MRNHKAFQKILGLKGTLLGYKFRKVKGFIIPICRKDMSTVQQ